jgi:hypothetical protein
MFPKLDEQLATFDEAVRAWYPKRLPEPETLDASGKLAQEALSQARALTLALLAGDSAKVDELRGKLEASRDALAKRAKEAASEPHGRFVTPRIDPLLRAASVSAPLDGAKEYALTAAFADLVEANHRSLAQLLRMRGDMMPGVSGPLRGGGSPHGKLPH